MLKNRIRLVILLVLSLIITSLAVPILSCHWIRYHQYFAIGVWPRCADAHVGPCKSPFIFVPWAHSKCQPAGHFLGCTTIHPLENEDIVSTITRRGEEQLCARLKIHAQVADWILFNEIVDEKEVSRIEQSGIEILESQLADSDDDWFAYNHKFNFGQDPSLITRIGVGVIYVKVGWPFRSHAYWARGDSNGSLVIDNAITYSLSQQHSPRVLLPTKVLFAGFAGNVGFYVFILALLSLMKDVLMYARNSLRAIQGRCASCGYIINDVANKRCPECGKPHRVKAVRPAHN